jgi:hypothetical protein
MAAGDSAFGKGFGFRDAPPLVEGPWGFLGMGRLVGLFQVFGRGLSRFFCTPEIFEVDNEGYSATNALFDEVDGDLRGK